MISEICSFCYASYADIELYLRKIRNTSSGYDDLPCWVLKQCSYELSSIVDTIFNKSFQTGTVHVDWLTAVVTPIPKIPRPTGLTDYRPISVTPILSGVAEKIVVRQWLRPAIIWFSTYWQYHQCIISCIMQR